MTTMFDVQLKEVGDDFEIIDEYELDLELPDLSSPLKNDSQSIMIPPPPTKGCRSIFSGDLSHSVMLPRKIDMSQSIMMPPQEDEDIMMPPQKISMNMIPKTEIFIPDEEDEEDDGFVIVK